MLALYVHRTSPVHRLSAGVKLAASFAAGTLLFFIDRLYVLGGFLIAVCGLYLLARLSLKTILHSLRPLLIAGAVIFLVHLLLSSAGDAARIMLRLTALILLTSLVTLTTRFSDMLDAIARAARPLAVFGLTPAKLALAAGLVIRFIPALLHDMAEVRRARMARRARGLRKFGAGPVIIKILRMTDALAAAISARGFENRK